MINLTLSMLLAMLLLAVAVSGLIALAAMFFCRRWLERETGKGL